MAPVVRKKGACRNVYNKANKRSMENTDGKTKKRPSIYDKKRLLEQSFSSLNSEMAQFSNGPLEGAGRGISQFNVFMDVLKVAPVIDLELVEEETSKISGTPEYVETDEVVETNMDTIAERHGKLNGKYEEKSPLNSTSDIDLREKPDDIFKLRKMNESKNRDKQKTTRIGIEDSSSQIKDMDLRERNNLQIMETSSKMDLTVCSSSLKPTKEKFISRVRMANLSSTIDLNMDYEITGLRYFQEIKGKELDQTLFQPVPLSIASFNVLCQYSMEKTLYLYRHLQKPHKRRYSEWEGRRPKLQEEFDRLAADVFCLQEIQDNHYSEFYQPYFTNRGYQSIFTRRSAQDTPDGCAIFWRTSKLQLLNFKPIFYNLGVEGMNCDNVGQVAIFGIQGFLTALCISNTHIYYNMKRGEVKLAQIAYLLSSIKEMEKRFRTGNLQSKDAKNYVHFAGHILSGDFNLYPGSPLHRFIVDRRIDLKGADRINLAFAHREKPKSKQPSMYQHLVIGENHIPRIGKRLLLPIKKMRIFSDCTFVDGKSDSLLDTNFDELRHDLKLASVYEHWNVLGEPELSSYHVDQAHPDFIFYSVADQREIFNPMNMEENAKNLDLLLNGGGGELALAHESCIQLRKRLSLPVQAQLDKSGGKLPNEQYGSDHLSLWAGFNILCLPSPTCQKA